MGFERIAYRKEIWLREVSIDSYRALLKCLGERTGVDDCAADGDGFCALQFDDNIIVHLQFDPGSASITLSGNAGEIDEDYCSEINTALLETNAAFRTGNGLVFGLDPVTRSIELYQRLPATIDFDGFESSLSGFVNELERWQEVVARQGQVVDALVAENAEEAETEDGGASADDEGVIWG